jgi:SAM-dependent methyltransferase
MIRMPAAFSETYPACATAERLPFADNTFDLVFCQLALLWMPLPATVAEIGRVVQPGGAVVAIEPDYGGMIEYPARIATRELWIAGLQRAGADPYVGRKLPVLLAQQGFEIRTDLMSQLTAPVPERFDLLRGLPLTDAERAHLDRIQKYVEDLTSPWTQLIHLPFFFLSGELPGS